MKDFLKGVLGSAVKEERTFFTLSRSSLSFSLDCPVAKLPLWVDIGDFVDDVFLSL